VIKMPSKGDFISDGYALEHRVVGYLESNGYFPIKSHMSKGIVDVVAVKPGGEIRFVQCKLSNWGGDEFEELKELNERFSDATVEYAILSDSSQLKFRNIEDMIEEENDLSFEIEKDQTAEHATEVMDFIQENTDDDSPTLLTKVVKSAMSKQLDTTTEEIEEAIERLKRQGELFEPEKNRIQSI